ncbi:MAG: LysR substrate-binding domain-containing protein [Pseudomonadota bacterium]
MATRLPPLTALRAFDAAARHLSFSDAAAELSVTPAALSQQIKSLEAHLGAEVFRRLNRRVELTEAGETLAPGIGGGFQALREAWSAALRRVQSNSLTVTAGPVFLANYLAPRMGSFVLAHPEVELRFTASLRTLSFDRDGIDLAVRFGPGSDAGYFSEVIFEDWATPMCAPEAAGGLRHPRDLRDRTVIDQDSGPTLMAFERWDTWCAAVGIPVPPSHGPAFSAPDGALSFAAGGGGVVLGRVSLADPLLTAGRLVMPFAQTIRRGLRYRIVCPKGFETSANARLFRTWIREEIALLSRWETDRIFV